MYNELERTTLAGELAAAFLTGPWKAEDVAESGAACLDRWPSWMTALALSVVAVFRTPPSDRPGELARLIETFLAEHAAKAEEPEPPRILRLLAGGGSGQRHSTGRLSRRGVARTRPPLEHDWPIAKIDSADDLAERLELSGGQLAWLADVRGLERTVTAEKLRNYRYLTVARGDGLPRVIESPKARLKEIQRWLLHEILDHVPPHDAAHGFTRGRSVISHARLHTHQETVLRLDLKDFFASIAAARVYGIFVTMGYAPSVAHVLTGLSTNTVAQAVWSRIPRTAERRLVQPRFWLGRQLATPHLPQGAPTSPALANLAAFRLDRRLTGLARASGLRYSRYADDLTFSGAGALRRRAEHFQEVAAKIAPGGGLRHQPGEVCAAHGWEPSIGLRRRCQCPSERDPRRVRPAESHAPQRRPSRTAEPEPQRGCRFRVASTRPDRLGREPEPAARRAATAPLRGDRLGSPARREVSRGRGEAGAVVHPTARSGSSRLAAIMIAARSCAA